MDGRERFSAVKNICAAQMGSKGFDRALTSQSCSTAICAFLITCSPHWHSHVRPVTEHAQTVEVRTGLACVLHPTAGRDHAASARSSRGTQGSFWGAPTHKGQGTGCSHLHDSWRGRCAPPRSRSSFASAQLGAASPTATGRLSAGPPLLAHREILIPQGTKLTLRPAGIAGSPVYHWTP